MASELRRRLRTKALLESLFKHCFKTFPSFQQPHTTHSLALIPPPETLDKGVLGYSLDIRNKQELGCVLKTQVSEHFQPERKPQLFFSSWLSLWREMTDATKADL